MWSLEKYFRNQLHSHRCQLHMAEEFELIKKAAKARDKIYVSQNSLEAYMKMGTISAVWHEKLRQYKMTKGLVIHPYSEFNDFWHFFMFFFLLICFFIYPVTSAFHGPFLARKLLHYQYSFICFYVFLFVLLLVQLLGFMEIVVNFMTGYASAGTKEVVIDPSGIAKKYLYTYFLLDFLPCLPIDITLVFVLGVQKYSELPVWTVILLGLLPLLKLARLKALLDHSRVVFLYFCSSSYIYNMIVASFFCPFIAHLGACSMVAIPVWTRYNQLLPPPVTENCSFSWLVGENLFTMPIYSQYFHAYYRSLMTFIHTGSSLRCLVSVEDKALVLLLSVIGKIYRVVLLVVFLQMLSMLMMGRVLYLEMMDQVKQYISIKRFPKDLKRKVLLNYLYLYQKEYTQENQILKMLSDSVRREILLWLHKSLIKKVYFFSGLSRNLILAIVSCLQPEIYLEDDVVYSAGEEGDCMYFISFGTVAVYTRNNVETGHLDDGEHFGEVSLILHLRRVETVIAVEPTQLFKLTAQDFADLIKAYPTVYSKIEKMATERYRTLFANEMNLRTKEDDT